MTSSRQLGYQGDRFRVNNNYAQGARALKRDNVEKELCRRHNNNIIIIMVENLVDSADIRLAGSS